MIGKEEIARMKHGVRIVNVARGELIDEEALVEGLRSGKVAGAAIDVFEQEPYSGPLLGIENVVVTPHLGASTREAQDRAGVIVAEQVAADARGPGRLERGQRAGRPARGARVPRAVPPARGDARRARVRARRREPELASSSSTSASWRAATRASSRWRH